MCFRNYGVPKTWLDQSLKSNVSEDPSKSNMVNAIKNCRNLKDASRTKFIYHSEGNCLTKSFC